VAVRTETFVEVLSAVGVLFEGDDVSGGAGGAVIGGDLKAEVSRASCIQYRPRAMLAAAKMRVDCAPIEGSSWVCSGA
jgi:hypothetical protein